MNKKNMDVVELFAGVGGFRLGLEKSGWKTVFCNQWEPGSKSQWAFNCYNSHFPDSININEDIATIKASDIPDHALLVGGFPCQDYSVAATLSSSKGIEGKKGVLWWEIRRIVEEKKPRFILLENVDRLLKSPAKQRGRDFGIILSCLNSLGYSVEWRVINAAEYGFQQRRRRTFIFATNDSNVQEKLYGDSSVENILTSKGFFGQTFCCELKTKKEIKPVQIPTDLLALSDRFSSLFSGAGLCMNFNALSADVNPIYAGPQRTLGSLLESNVDEKYYISDDKLEKWEYLKGAKREERITSAGFKYFYSEGPIAYPDHLDKPARTMLTSEGSVNRSSHVVKDPETGRMRILTPVECERIDGFPDNWTEGMPNRMRYFTMGNALVVDLIEKMGDALSELV